MDQTGKGQTPQHFLRSAALLIVTLLFVALLAPAASGSGIPYLVGSVTTGPGNVSVCAAGDHVYELSQDNTTLYIIDVSDKTSPAVSGSVLTGGNPCDLAVQGSYAYVTTATNTFEVYDVSNPVSPAARGTLHRAAPLGSVAVSGNYAYVTVAADNQFDVINISDPDAPSLVTSVSVTGTGPNSVMVEGAYLYVIMAAAGNGRLQIFSLTDPAAPSPVGSADFAGNPVSVFASGNYAHVTSDGVAQLQVFDVSNPAAPTAAGAIDISATPRDLFVQNGYAYVADVFFNTINIYKITNGIPTLADSIPVTGGPNCVCLQGMNVYEGGGLDDSFKVFDLTGVNLSPEADGKSCGQGQVATYTVTATNDGTTDAFGASVTGNTWPTTVSPSGFSLDNGQNVGLTLRVTVPAGVPSGATDNAVLHVISSSNPGKSDTCTITTTASSNPVPSISSISPATRNEDTTGFTLTVNGAGFMSSSKVRWNGSNRTTTYVSSSRLTASIPQADIASDGTAQVAVKNPAPGGGVSNARPFTIRNVPPTITKMSLTVGRPGQPVTITGTRLGPEQDDSCVLFNGARAVDYDSWSDTRIIACVPPDATTGPVFVKNQDGVSNSTGFEVYKPNCYSPEGTTAHGMSEIITLMNTSDEEVRGTLVLTAADGRIQTVNIVLKPNGVTSIDPSLYVKDKDFEASFSTDQQASIVMDRTMTLHAPTGEATDLTSSICQSGPATTSYMPDGSSRWGFDTYTLIQNPNRKAARVNLTYMPDNGPSVRVVHEVPAESRLTVNMLDDVGPADASIKVEADSPVVAEQAMYRNHMRAGSATAAAVAPSSEAHLAEGSTAWGFDTYLLTMNPNPRPVKAKMSFNTPDGKVVMDPVTIPAESRITTKVDDITPGKGFRMDMSNTDFSTKVTGSSVTDPYAKEEIVVGRTMVWNENSPGGPGMSSAIAVGRPHATWNVPNDVSSDQTSSYILISNPNSNPVRVNITGYTADQVLPSFPIDFNDDNATHKNMQDLFGQSVAKRIRAVQVKSVTENSGVVVEKSTYLMSKDPNSRDLLQGGATSMGAFADEKKPGYTFPGGSLWINALRLSIGGFTW